MISAQGQKFTIMRTWATAATDSDSTAAIDCTGFKWAQIQVLSPAAAATNSNDKLAVLQVAEATNTSGTYTAIAALTGTTNSSATSGFVIQTNNNTSVGIQHVLHRNLSSNKNALKVSVRAGDTNHTRIAIVAALSRAEEWPNSTTEANAFYVVS